MVIRHVVNNLKERPKDERKAVAGGIAIAVVAILLIGWSVLFFKKIQHDTLTQQQAHGQSTPQQAQPASAAAPDYQGGTLN